MKIEVGTGGAQSACCMDWGLSLPVEELLLMEGEFPYFLFNEVHPKELRGGKCYHLQEF